jgi:hypothetical protein
MTTDARGSFIPQSGRKNWASYTTAKQAIKAENKIKALELQKIWRK